MSEIRILKIWCLGFSLVNPESDSVSHEPAKQSVAVHQFDSVAMGTPTRDLASSGYRGPFRSIYSSKTQTQFGGHSSFHVAEITFAIRDDPWFWCAAGGACVSMLLIYTVSCPIRCYCTRCLREVIHLELLPPSAGPKRDHPFFSFIKIDQLINIIRWDPVFPRVLWWRTPKSKVRETDKNYNANG